MEIDFCEGRSSAIADRAEPAGPEGAHGGASMWQAVCRPGMEVSANGIFFSVGESIGKSVRDGAAEAGGADGEPERAEKR